MLRQGIFGMNIDGLGGPDLPPWWIYVVVSVPGTGFIVALVFFGHYLWKNRRNGAVAQVKSLGPSTTMMATLQQKIGDEELAERTRKSTVDGVMKAMATAQM